MTTIGLTRALISEFGVLFQHRANEPGRMHAFAPRIDERPFDMDPKRAGNAILRLARGRQRLGEHPRRVGHDRRQEAGDARAPMRGGDRGDPLHRRLGVEQSSSAAVDLPIDKARRENSPAEIDRFAAARAVLEAGQRCNRCAFNDERAVVVKPFAVEQARPRENFHCAVCLFGRDDCPSKDEHRPSKDVALKVRPSPPPPL